MLNAMDNGRLAGALSDMDNPLHAQQIRPAHHAQKLQKELQLRLGNGLINHKTKGAHQRVVPVHINAMIVMVVMIVRMVAGIARSLTTHQRPPILCWL